jgi:hypothetical protein
VQSSHTFSTESAVFDERNLVSAGGLVAAPVLAVGDAAAYLAAARMCGAAPAGPGIATAGTPGVPSWLASQGNAAAKACDAKGQSCLPG